MNILARYIGRYIMVTTLLAMGVLTFVLLCGNLLQAFELLAKGIPLATISQYLLLHIPSLLTYTLPLATLCAAVLVFSRLSADNEVLAMRASGRSLWEIVTPALLWSVLLSVACVVLQLKSVPSCKYAADRMVETAGADNALAFLKEGAYVKVMPYIIYVGKREGGQLRNVHVYKLNRQGERVQEITARKGRIAPDTGGGRIRLELRQARIVTLPELRRVAGGEVTVPIDTGKAGRAQALTRKAEYMSISALFGKIRLLSKRDVPVTPLYVEIHKRLALAISPFALMLVGIPFGLRTHRRETSIGIVVSVVLGVFFYMFLVLGEALENEPAYHPEILMWVPNILYQIGGIYGMFRGSG